MLINPFDIERYLRIIARRADLGVVFEDDIHPRASHNKVYLPRPSILTTPQQFENLKRWIIHETNHHNYSDIKLFESTGLERGNSFLSAIWNNFEDIRIDHIGADAYAGDGEVIGNTWAPDVEEAVDRVLKNGTQQQQDMILPQLAISAAARMERFPSSASALAKLESAMSPLGKERYQKMLDKGYVDALKNTFDNTEISGTRETQALAERCFREIYEQDPDKEKERCQQEMEAEGKGKDGDKKDGKEKGKAKGKGESGEPVEGTNKGEGELTEAQGQTVKWSDLMPGEGHDHKITQADKGKGLTIDYSDYTTGAAWQQLPFDQYKIANFPRNEFHPDLKDRYDLVVESNVEHLKKHDERVSPGFANLVRAKLQIRSRAKTQYGMKRGKIASRSLYRTALVDAPDLQEKIFKNTVKTDVLDVAVGILVDASGSMTGSKIAHAAVSASLLNEALGNVLHIPIEIAAFSDDSYATSMYVVREYNTPILGKDLLFERFGHLMQRMNGNADGEAILWMWDRLVKRKEKRKVLIVLSDGSPACSRGSMGGDIFAYTAQVTNKIQRDGRVDLVGIGIKDRNVEHFYKERYTIDNVGQLESALLQLIDRKIV